MPELKNEQFVAIQEITGFYGTRIWISKNASDKIHKFLGLVSPWGESDKQLNNNHSFELPFGLGQQIKDILVKRFFMSEVEF